MGGAGAVRLAVGGAVAVRRPARRRALAWLGEVLLVVPAVWLYRAVLTPLGHAIAWPARGIGAGFARLFTGVTAVVTGSRRCRALFGRVYVRLLAPVGRSVAWLLRGVGLVLAASGSGVHRLAWLARYLLVVPPCGSTPGCSRPSAGRSPAGRGARAVVRMIFWASVRALLDRRVLLVLPALAVWRWVLVPVGRVLAVVAREVGEALGHAWRVAG